MSPTDTVSRSGAKCGWLPWFLLVVWLGWIAFLAWTSRPYWGVSRGAPIPKPAMQEIP